MVAPYAGTPTPPQPDETGTEICIPVTNAIEALHAKLRRAIRARGHFPTDEAVLKLLFLVCSVETLAALGRSGWLSAVGREAAGEEDVEVCGAGGPGGARGGPGGPS
jgi:hypothetical protein